MKIIDSMKAIWRSGERYLRRKNSMKGSLQNGVSRNLCLDCD